MAEPSSFVPDSMLNTDNTNTFGYEPSFYAVEGSLHGRPLTFITTCLAIEDPSTKKTCFYHDVTSCDYSSTARTQPNGVSLLHGSRDVIPNSEVTLKDLVQQWVDEGGHTKELKAFVGEMRQGVDCAISQFSSSGMFRLDIQINLLDSFEQADPFEEPTLAAYQHLIRVLDTRQRRTNHLHIKICRAAMGLAKNPNEIGERPRVYWAAVAQRILDQMNERSEAYVAKLEEDLAHPQETRTTSSPGTVENAMREQV